MKKSIIIVFLLSSVSLLGQTGEFLIDTCVGYVPALNSQYSSSVAFDGTNYFVVWHEDRYTDPNDYNIYGTRVGQDGMVLDPSGIAISIAQHSQEFPAIAFGGTNYFIVWQSGTSGANFYDVYGARVDPATGQILDPDGIPISTTGSEERAPSVAFDGTNYFVVWGHGGDIHGARINQAGTVLDPGGITISAASNEQSFPSVAFDGTNYLVAWTDRRSYYDIYGARVDTSGNVLDPDGIPISITPDCQARPSVSFGGNSYLVAWQDWPSGGIPDIYGARIDKDGVVLDSSGIAISTAAGGQFSPSVAFDGTNFIVAWDDGRSGSDIYGARVDTSGNVLDPSGIPISTAANEQWHPAVAFGDTNYLVTWTDWRKGYSPEIYGTRVSKQGNVFEPNGIIISTMMYWQWNPSVSYDGVNYFVVWQDYRNGSEPDIYGTRVDTSGNVLDSLCISISTAINWQYEPSVIHNGTNHYFIVWADTRTGNNADIYGARVDAMGNVLDPSGIPISTASNTQYSPAAAFDGTNYFVVWTDLRSGSYSHIYGARVDTTGTVLDPSGIPISAGDYWQCYPAVAFDGTNYFVVWTDYNSGGNFYDLYGARVDVSGNVLDPAGISISIGPEDQSNPSVAFDGENYFVVWQDERNEGSLVYDIYGARVDTTGTVLDPSGIPIVTVPNSQELPSLVFDETNHLCVWQDSRDDPDFYDIYGARINTSGILIDSFIVSNQTEEQITPVLARGSGNQALITYSGFVDYINGQPANTMRIWGKLYPSVGIEETSTVNFRILKLDVFPNPFRQTTEIRYQISGVGQDFSLALKIFDATGRLVKDLSRFTAYDLRSTSITWYGDDDLGRELPAGVYFVRLESSRYKEVEKVILLR